MLQPRKVKPMTACPFCNNFSSSSFLPFSLCGRYFYVSTISPCAFISDRIFQRIKKKKKCYAGTSGVSRIECLAVRLFTSLGGRHRYHSHRTDHFIIYFVFFFYIEFLKPYTDYRAGEKEAVKLESWCVKPYVEPTCREDEKKKHLSVLGCNRNRKETN